MVPPTHVPGRRLRGRRMIRELFRRPVQLHLCQRIIADSEMIGACDAAFGRRKSTFQQDGAPSHTAIASMEWLSERVNLLPGWPPNRCDLSQPNRGGVGSLVGAPARSERFAALQVVWDDISSSTTDALVADFRRRCTLVIEANGASISQLLSSHMRQPRDVVGRGGDVA